MIESNIHFDLKHLRTLAALADTGSLSAAASRLHLTQSALSHQLKTLETQLDGPLFIRKSRPLRFTRRGERLLRLAHEVLPKIEAACRDIQRLADGETGRLFIAIECHSCFAWLMPAMDRFRRAWPEVEMDLVTSYTFDPLPALRGGELDLVVTSDRQTFDDVLFIPLFRYQALLALSHDHPLCRRKWIEPQDLRDETLITYPVERDRLDIFTRFLNPAGVEPARVRHTELTLMIMQLVASGRGVAALPDWALTEYLEKEYVTARPLGKKGLEGKLFAAIRKEDAQRPWMEEFLRIARKSTQRTTAASTTRNPSDFHKSV